MAFLTPAEMSSAIYEYQLTQITEGDETIVLTAINTAIEEVKGYLSPNQQRQYQDGRPLYDVDAIFAAEGDDRNALVLSYTKTVTEWWCIQLSNPDLLFDHVKERYDRVTKYLESVRDGKMNINSLPVLDPETDPVAAKEPFRYGSRTKFNHE